MTRVHRRSTGRRNPGLKDQRRQDADTAQRQQPMLAGLPMQWRHQHRLDIWAQGTAQLDNQMRAARQEPHAMAPMGSRAPFDNICEQCGAGRDDRHEPEPGRTIGKRVHW